VSDFLAISELTADDLNMLDDLESFTMFDSRQNATGTTTSVTHTATATVMIFTNCWITKMAPTTTFSGCSG